MLCRSVLMLSIVFAAATGFAAQPTAFVVENGSVARCNDSGDIGHRAFRIAIDADQSAHVVLNIETLVCAQVGEQLVLKPMALTSPLVFDGAVTSEFSQAEIVLTNSELTQELLRINLNGQLTVQQITLDTRLLSEKSIDLTIMGLEVTKKNLQMQYQEVVSGGHYRFKNLKN